MLALRPHLPADFCERAAQYVMDHPGHTVIVTGFYVIMAGKPETDGPPAPSPSVAPCNPWAAG